MADLERVFRHFDERHFSQLFPAGRISANGNVLEEGEITKPIFHYTTVDTLEKILINKTLRFTQISALNDKFELMHGVELAEGALGEETFDQYSSQSQEIIESGIQKFRKYGRDEKEVFVFSTSVLPDDLSQWRGYGGMGGGIAIGIDPDISKQSIFSEMHVKNAELIYSEESKKSLVLDAAKLYASSIDLLKEENLSCQEKDHLVTNFAAKIFNCVMRFKHNAFHSEKEFRLYLWQNELNRQHLDDLIGYSIQAGKVVYHVDIPFKIINNTSPIMRIHLGPASNDHAQQLGVYAMLRANGFPAGISVLPSQIPYQTR